MVGNQLTRTRGVGFSTALIPVIRRVSLVSAPALLYPVNLPAEFDLGAHFAKKRRSFFVILIILSFADPLTAAILGAEHLIDLGWPYWHWMLTCLVGGSASLWFTSRLFQHLFAIYWGLSLVGFAVSWQYSVG